MAYFWVRIMPVASQIGRVLRQSLAKLHQAFDPVADSFPGIKGALARLDSAVAEELATTRHVTSRDIGIYDHRLKRLKNQRDFEKGGAG